MSEIVLLITLAFIFGFFIESVFGFAGTVISFVILSFFIDIKTLVSLVLFVSTVASVSILITDKNSFAKKEYLMMVVMAIPGAVLGAFLLGLLPSVLLLKILGICLLGLSLISFFEPNFKANVKRLLLFISGIVHGMFGLGGIVAIGTMKNGFAHKSQLRTTFAVFFITLNLLRGTQYAIQGTLEYQAIMEFWWLPLPLFMVIWFGHKIHRVISEVIFKKGISVLLSISGIFLLSK